MWIAVGVLALVVIAVLVVAATKPNELRIERSARINASPERIFPHINDFNRWVNWSPYESEDFTEIVSVAADGFAVLRSSEDTDNRPAYGEVARFPSLELARRFVKDGELT